MPKVDFQRAEYSNALTDWQLVADVCDGQRSVKAKGKTYLPDPNEAQAGEPEEEKVYDRYKQRASFFGATGNTLQYLVGAAFRKWPELQVPPALEYISDDIDGAGLSIYQQSQDVESEVLKKGRHGLLVDYPRTTAPASVADKASGLIRAATVSIDANRIINWRTMKVGGKHVLTLVVFWDNQDELAEDGFESSNVEQIRALRLIDGVYTVELYRKNERKDWVLFETFTPLNGNGRPWSQIPFTFVGARNNDTQVDRSPLLDLAELNIYHYQVSADWRNALHYAGQPQPWMSGLNQAWVDMLEEKGLVLGSRAPVLLPEGGQYGVATVAADSALESEIKNVEQRLIAIGARLITKGEAVKTATEAQGDNEAQHSVLSLVSSNVSEAYTLCLGWMLEFENTSGEVLYTISQDYAEHRIDAQMLTALVAAWQSGRLPDSDFYAVMRKYGLVGPEKTDEEIREELETSGAGLNLDSDGDQ